MFVYQSYFFQDEKPIADISLLGSICEDVSETSLAQRPFCFRLSHVNGTLFVQASSQEEMKEWILAIQQAASLKNSTNLQPFVSNHPISMISPFHNRDDIPYIFL